MKLDGREVCRHLFKMLTNSSNGADGGLPTVDIEGVKCVVDTTGRTVRTGEGREQAWYEVTIHDVTPNRFLTPEEQTEKRSESDEWWNVTGPSAVTFVRAKSRSLAMMYYAEKYREIPADCELSRGFDFIDPTAEKLPELAVELMPLFTYRAPVAKIEEMETEPPPETETEDPPFLAKAADAAKESLESPDKYYFGIAENPQDGVHMFIVLKTIWDEIDTTSFYHTYHLPIQHLLPKYLGEPETEQTWSIPKSKMSEDVAIDMTLLGFERNLDVERALTEV